MLQELPLYSLKLRLVGRGAANQARFSSIVAFVLATSFLLCETLRVRYEWSGAQRVAPNLARWSKVQQD